MTTSELRWIQNFLKRAVGHRHRAFGYPLLREFALHRIVLPFVAHGGAVGKDIVWIEARLAESQSDVVNEVQRRNPYQLEVLWICHAGNQDVDLAPSKHALAGSLCMFLMITSMTFLNVSRRLKTSFDDVFDTQSLRLVDGKPRRNQLTTVRAHYEGQGVLILTDGTRTPAPMAIARESARLL